MDFNAFPLEARFISSKTFALVWWEIAAIVEMLFGFEERAISTHDCCFVQGAADAIKDVRKFYSSMKHPQFQGVLVESTQT
jgi:hypothetical protein